MEVPTHLKPVVCGVVVLVEDYHGTPVLRDGERDFLVELITQFVGVPPHEFVLRFPVSRLLAEVEEFDS